MRGGGRLLSSNLKGFTLAEVLVTLGIIGVVSAMTVPSLMQNYQRQSYVTQLHKVYNELSQASIKYMTDNNAINLREAGLNSVDASVDFIKENFKIVQDCGTDAVPCFADSYKKLSGFSVTANDHERYFVLANGASIATTFRSQKTYGDMVLDIFVDSNGKKGPNILGRDFFIMYVYNNGVIDDINFEEKADGDGLDITVVPLSSDYRERMFTTYCKGNTNYRRGCFGKILNDNWQMNY